MRRLRKISLEDFDKLTSLEASKLMGGNSDVKPVNYSTPPPNAPYKPVYFDVPYKPTYNSPIGPTFKPPGFTVTGYF